MESGAPHALLVGRPVLAFALLCVFVLFCMLLCMLGRIFDLFRLSILVWDLVFPFGFDRYLLFTLCFGYVNGAISWLLSLAVVHAPGFQLQVLLVRVSSLIGFYPFLVLPMNLGILSQGRAGHFTLGLPCDRRLLRLLMFVSFSFRDVP